MFGQPTLLFFAALKSNPLMTGEQENQRREFFTYPVVHFLTSLQAGGENLSHMCVFGGGGGSMWVGMIGLEKDMDVNCDGNCTLRFFKTALL